MSLEHRSGFNPEAEIPNGEDLDLLSQDKKGDYQKFIYKWAGRLGVSAAIFAASFGADRRFNDGEIYDALKSDVKSKVYEMTMDKLDPVAYQLCQELEGKISKSLLYDITRLAQEKRKDVDTPPIEEMQYKSGVSEVIENLPDSFKQNIDSVVSVQPPTVGDKARVYGFVKSGYREINLANNITEQELPFLYDTVIPHEAGHLNDWDSNKLLSVTERLELLKQVIAIVERDLKKDYSQGDHESKRSLENTVEERFANMVAMYLSPIKREFLDLESAKIVKQLLEKTDPDFDLDHHDTKALRLIMQSLQKM